VRHLVRIGYDRFSGFLDGGLAAWETGGRRYDQIPAIFAGDLNIPATMAMIKKVAAHPIMMASFFGLNSMLMWNEP
jgi:hypothetical protein